MIALAAAFAFVGITAVGAALYAAMHLGRAIRPMAERILSVLEREPVPIGGTGDVEPLPHDLAERAGRFGSQWARDSEEAAYREAFKRYGSWEKVRLAMNLLEGE